MTAFRFAAILSSCVLIGAGIAPASASAQDQARKCTAMAKTFDAKTTEVEALTQARAQSAAAAEAAGEAWENAETVRHFSAEQAQAADRAKAAWDTAKADFHGKDAALRSAAAMLNRDIVEYNRACAPEN
ncbi:MAG: hypothetical protein AAGJ32_09895 [Pseudomonadota bacterium]